MAARACHAAGGWRVATGDRTGCHRPLDRDRERILCRACQCLVACLIPPRGVNVDGGLAPDLNSEWGISFLFFSFYRPAGHWCGSHCHKVVDQTLAAANAIDSAGCSSPVYDEANRCCFRSSPSLSEFQSSWFLIDSHSQYLQLLFFILSTRSGCDVCFRELSLAWEHIEKNMQHAYAWVGSMD
jgi:hypothetical protein